MKKWLRISLLIVALVGASILIYARLESNKAEMEAEARTVRISSEATGKVERIFFDEGTYVAVGTPLLKLNDEQIRANLVAAKANYEKARKDWERFEALAKENVATGQQLDNARLMLATAQSQYEIAQKQQKDTEIYSPTYGVVTQQLIEQGELANPGSPVAEITDISRLKVKVRVGEQEAFRLKMGESVAITTEVFPGTTFRGSITYIGVQADKAHTYPIEVSLVNNPQRQLKAGMFAKVNFTQQQKETSAVIPREALAGSVKDPYVYVIEGGVARKRPIQLGLQQEDRLEVLSGLKPGEQVVTAGQYGLTDGAQISIQ